MTYRRSISDDDLCSDCLHCDYQPGELSVCSLNWPGRRNADGYVIECARFDQGEKPAAPALTDEQRDVLALARSIIRDLCHDWPVKELANDPEVVCAELTRMIGSRGAYDFETGNVVAACERCGKMHDVDEGERCAACDELLASAPAVE